MAQAVHVPYVPATRSMAEITVKALILGAVLAVVLGAANTYLGLRVGLTVSASIPAAVVSMGVLRLFRKHNILENNIVQTAASAGESLSAGILFTLPALLLLGYWTEVNYLETTAVALAGGVLGVLFTVPLRRALIVETDLAFPEGIATSEVLKAGERGGEKGALVALVVGAVGGALFKFLQSANKLWADSAVFGRRFADNGIVAFGADLSPALLGVGYIIGLQIASLVFLGGVLGWLVGIPLYSLFGDPLVSTPGGMVDFTTVGDAVTTAGFLWSNKIRYIGVGAMLVGGLWTLVKLRSPLVQAFRQGLGVHGDEAAGRERPRTEQEFGMRPTFLGVAALSIPLFALYWYATGSLGASLVLAVIMLVSGFLFSAVGAYMAGLVGSSNNPISGVTIITVLFTAFVLWLMGLGPDVGPAATIFVAGTIAAAAAIGSDNMQDLKAGYLLGATPRKQQVMQMVGVVAAALTVALVLQVLTTAYELGSADLAAPQAQLMASVANMVFGIGDLPQDMLWIGIGIAFGLIVLDEVLARSSSSFRTPVMPVAVGIYLPIGLSAPIFLGGLIAWGTTRYLRRESPTMRQKGHHAGILFGSGLIAGEALIGIATAAIIVLGWDDAVSVGSGGLRWAGILMFAYVAAVLAYFVVRPRLVKET